MSDLAINSSSSSKAPLLSKAVSNSTAANDGVSFLKDVEKKQGVLREAGNDKEAFKIMQQALSSVNFDSTGGLVSTQV